MPGPVGLAEFSRRLDLVYSCSLRVGALFAVHLPPAFDFGAALDTRAPVVLGTQSVSVSLV